VSAPEPLRVAVVGAGGRLGRFACGLLERSDGFVVAARLGRSDALEAALRASEAALGLDLTAAGCGARHGLTMLAAGVRPVIGTSGVTPDEVAELDRRARELELGGLVVPNFSLGMALLVEAAERLAPWFDAVEIVELHHAGKRDAPSATALDAARRLAAARTPPTASPAGPGAPDELAASARGHREAGVPIHALRLPGAPARQTIELGSEAEAVRLEHEARGPAAYAPGILLALRHAASATGVRSGLRHALDASGPRAPQDRNRRGRLHAEP